MTEESTAKRQKVEKAVEEKDAVKPILYSYWRSSCSWRVRIALHMKKVDFDYKAIHLVKSGGEQLMDDYVAMNPMKEVPTLKIGDTNLGQSMAILSYLDEKYPCPALLPTEPIKRAKARQLAEIISTGTQPVQNLRVLVHYKKSHGGDDEKKMAWGKYWIEYGLKAFEKEVASTAGKYCVGDEVTTPDLCLVPQLYNARRFKCDLEQFPLCLKIEAELMKLQAFKDAAPDQQPDAVKA
mmetsp:Transcript_5384/g.8456  ORF Transcript_5384/g.8456 Transcript_5384/m.8456 type:complete len:238 (+) Transcript_5384:58-771(+)